MLKHSSIVILLAVFAMPARASSPDAWQELWQKSERACLTASKFRQAKSNVLVEFQDSIMRIVEGRHPQPHMNNAPGTKYCLYNKKSGRTELSEPSAP
ncbi:MAG: hypothetical protein LCH38_09310 [Proteobacteria bacterium]|nr:hypothetical protein [Pseudomonadota bacterium]